MRRQHTIAAVSHEVTHAAVRFEGDPSIRDTMGWRYIVDKFAGKLEYKVQTENLKRI